jgi:hypothetical protein
MFTSLGSDSGQSTAEYAVGTVGAACIGCILIQCGQSDWFLDLVQSILFRIGLVVDGVGLDPTIPRLPVL